MENFKIDVDADGIALITFDVPGRSMYTLTSGVLAEIPQWVERVKTDDAIKGAVLTSGKASGFCAGADLGDMASGMLGGADLQAAYDAGGQGVHRPARHIEGDERNAVGVDVDLEVFHRPKALHSRTSAPG